MGLAMWPEVPLSQALSDQCRKGIRWEVRKAKQKVSWIFLATTSHPTRRGSFNIFKWWWTWNILLQSAELSLGMGSDGISLNLTKNKTLNSDDMIEDQPSQSKTSGPKWQSTVIWKLTVLELFIWCGVSFPFFPSCDRHQDYLGSRTWGWSKAYPKCFI